MGAGPTGRATGRRRKGRRRCRAGLPEAAVVVPILFEIA